MGQSQLNFVLNPDIGIWEQWKIKFVKQATQLTASLEMLCLRTWWTPTAGSTPLLRNLSTKLFCRTRWHKLWTEVVRVTSKVVAEVGKDVAHPGVAPLDGDPENIKWFSSAICCVFFFMHLLNLSVCLLRKSSDPQHHPFLWILLDASEDPTVLLFLCHLDPWIQFSVFFNSSSPLWPGTTSITSGSASPSTSRPSSSIYPGSSSVFNMYQHESHCLLATW